MKLLTTLILSLNLCAALPIGVLKNLNANYVTPVGSATADYLNFQDLGEFHKPELKVANNEGVLTFSYEDKKFEIDMNLFAVQDADYVTVKNFNLSNDEKAINLSFSRVSAKALDSDAKVYDVSFNCKRSGVIDDVFSDLFQTCFTNSQINIDRFDYTSTEASFHNLIDDSKAGEKITVSNIDIYVADERFDGRLDSNLTWGIDVRFDGAIKYIASEKLVELRVDNVRASILSIRSKVFKELKANVPDNIVVEEPYIKIYIP